MIYLNICRNGRGVLTFVIHCMYIYIYVCVCVCLRTLMYVCMYVCVYAHVEKLKNEVIQSDEIILNESRLIYMYIYCEFVLCFRK